MYHHANITPNQRLVSDPPSECCFMTTLVCVLRHILNHMRQDQIGLK